MKKNCNNCSRLEYAYGDIGDPEGFICTRKDFSNEREEMEMLDKMDDEKYRNKSKRCFTTWEDYET